MKLRAGRKARFGMDYTDSEQGQHDLFSDEHSETEHLKECEMRLADMSIPDAKATVCRWMIEAIDSMAYEVWHPDGQGRPPRFQTWDEAIQKQVEWNRDVPGHVARRRIKMTNERKNITQPSDWWAAFEAHAKAEGLTLSAWLGEAAKAKLPPKLAKKLTERPPANRPKKPKPMT